MKEKDIRKAKLKGLSGNKDYNVPFGRFHLELP